VSVAVDVAPVFVARTAWQRPYLEGPDDGAGATSAPATTAQPAAVQRADIAQKDRDEGPLSKAEAVKFMAERRKEREAKNSLRLVPADDDDGAPLESDEANPADQVEATEANDGEPEPEKVPTWAQKLKTEHAKATETVQKLEAQRATDNAKYEAAHLAVMHAHEDLMADIKDEQAYSNMLEQAIAKAGLALPPNWKEKLIADRQVASLKRQLARGGHTQEQKATAEMHAKAQTTAATTLDSLRKKLPELDWEKVPEAKAWLSARFALDDNGKPVNPGAMKTIEADAVAFAKALRWDRSQKANEGKRTAQPKPNEQARPSSTTLNGAAQGAGAKRVPNVPKNEKESLAWLQSRRAARQ
jgi:hypothetical protein